MKKAVFALVLVLGIVCGVFCQTSGPMDLVVLLDTSSSMSNSYRETADYLVGPFLREFLRIGDTFHLISFSGAPRVEISRRIAAVEDVEAVIGRLLLMYPLYPETDLGSGLKFAEDYTSSLPGSRSRRLILITDGDAPDTQALADSSTSRLKSKGAEFQYIKVPVTGTGPSSGRPAVSGETRPPQVPAQTSQTSQAQQTQPQTGQASQPTQTQTPGQAAQVQSADSAGTGSSSQGIPDSSSSQSGQTAGQSGQAQTTQGSAQPSTQGTTQTAGTQSTGTQTTEPQTTGTQSTGTQTTGTQTTGTQSTGTQTTGTQTTGTQATGTQSTGTQTPVTENSGEGSLFGGSIPLPFLIALGILALLLLGLIIFFAARRLHSTPNRFMAQAAMPMDNENRDRLNAQRDEQLKDAEFMGSYAAAQKNVKKPMPKDKVYTEPFIEKDNDGQLMLNLFVEDQNTAIGRRNIHAVKAGYTFSIGGGKSDFLIFLVPIPPHIADVQYDGSNCTFYPRKSQYFPDIGAQHITNCIGKTIRVISDKQYELHIRIEKYEDPLKALNKMLHSISVSGEVK